MTHHHPHPNTPVSLLTVAAFAAVALGTEACDSTSSTSTTTSAGPTVETVSPSTASSTTITVRDTVNGDTAQFTMVRRVGQTPVHAHDLQSRTTP